ncbi:putative lipoprotein [Leptospira weilii serovar Topaz str. LT2116]|uniref:Putative lipoprotein n=1 Tax=Leptospira weilii serovar Topaz str. LT2116 TaxID=1088540 RepID=M3FPR8_9LEPT|nr:putative lipoprotein [Leptospira weilii serovar Topaz str. LT2116]
MIKIVNFTLVFLIALAACTKQIHEKIHVDTGVTVETLGPHKYKLVAIGGASSSSVEENDLFKMKNTSCAAAKSIAAYKLEELEPEQKNRLFFMEAIDTKYIDDGAYCQITFRYELPVPKKQP